MLKGMFTRETAFVLFLFAGYFKETLSFLPSFLDLTIVFCFISFAIAAKDLIKRPVIKKGIVVPIAIFMVFSIVLLASIQFSTSEIYAHEKTIRFLIITAWAFIGTFFLIRDEVSLKRFMDALIVLSLIMAAMSVFTFLKSQSSGRVGFVSVAGSNYTHLGRISGLGSLLLIGLYLYDAKYRNKVFIFLLVALTSFALAVCGSRMPLIAFVIAGVMLFYSSIKFKRGGVISIDRGIIPLFKLSVLITVGMAALFKVGALDTIVKRISTLFEASNGGASAEGRIDRYRIAWDMFKTHPIRGEGVGSFPMAYAHFDAVGYPHNIFLEIASELGIVGIILFCLLLLVAIVRNFTSSGSKHYRTVIFLGFIYALMNANISGDINDNRLFFTFLALMCISPIILKQNHQEPA